MSPLAVQMYLYVVETNSKLETPLAAGIFDTFRNFFFPEQAESEIEPYSIRCSFSLVRNVVTSERPKSTQVAIADIENQNIAKTS